MSVPARNDATDFRAICLVASKPLDCSELNEKGKVVAVSAVW